MARPGPQWSARDARQIPIPSGYGLAFGAEDPLASGPDIRRGGATLGLSGVYRRLDLGDAAAGRCLVAVVARGLALWPESPAARARAPERIDREWALVALGLLVDELHLAPGELDRAGRRRALLLPRERILASFLDGLRRLLRGARRLEERDLQTPEGPSSERMASDPQPDETLVAALEHRDQRHQLAHRLAELNRTWLGDSAYSEETLSQLLAEAGEGSSTERVQRIARWLDPARLHIKTACYVLRVAGEVSIAESHRLLFSAGFRAREGNPFSRNSVSACASMAKRALRSG